MWKKLWKKLYWWREPSEYLPPWYYGYVAYDPLSDRQWFAILPLNWLIRAGRYLVHLWDRWRGEPPRYELIERQVIYHLVDNRGNAPYVMFPYELRIAAHVLETLIPAIKEIGYIRRFTTEANRQLAAHGIPYRYQHDTMHNTVCVIGGNGEKVLAAEAGLVVALDGNDERSSFHW